MFHLLPVVQELGPGLRGLRRWQQLQEQVETLGVTQEAVWSCQHVGSAGDCGLLAVTAWEHTSCLGRGDQLQGRADTALKHQTEQKAFPVLLPSRQRGFLGQEKSLREGESPGGEQPRQAGSVEQGARASPQCCLPGHREIPLGRNPQHILSQQRGGESEECPPTAKR